MNVQTMENKERHRFLNFSQLLLKRCDSTLQLCSVSLITEEMTDT